MRILAVMSLVGIGFCDSNIMIRTLAFLLSLLAVSESFQQTRYYQNNLLPWSLARGGRRARFMSKPRVVNDDKRQRQIKTENAEENIKDDNSEAIFVEDLETQLRSKFSRNGIYRSQFKKIIEDFPSLDTAVGNVFI